MANLSSIQETVRQVADAITAALGIETEIVDDQLRIIGGTGRYVKKIGSFEENGDLSSDYLYAEILRTGKEYVCMDARNDPFYCQVEGELAEITCPIQLEDQVIGIIALIAFTAEQQEKIFSMRESFINFLRRMSELIASKFVESQSNIKLASMLESMPEGLLAVDKEGEIFSCNFECELLLEKKRDELIGKKITKLFPGETFFSNPEIQPSNEREILFTQRAKKKRLLFTVVPIPKIGNMYLFQDAATIAVKAHQRTFTGCDTAFDDIFGESDSMKSVKRRALQVSPNDSTILIRGESGTGKELFARAIHNSSLRSKEIFVPINCGAIPDALLESELFGYEKGAFTGAHHAGKIGKFELANKGTIFLDEIGDMPLHLQVKLLRVLQNRCIERVGGITPIDIDIRIIAATHKDLEAMVEKGEFREDLYFRLNIIPLEIPPLRSHSGDIESLLVLSLNRFSKLLGKKIDGFSEEALALLTAYPWPGNVRELENTVEYATNISDDVLIGTSDLPPRITSSGKTISFSKLNGTLKEQTDMAQRSIIDHCLRQTGKTLEGKRAAAKLLGISESTLYRKMRELEM